MLPASLMLFAGSLAALGCGRIGYDLDQVDDGGSSIDASSESLRSQFFRSLIFEEKFDDNNFLDRGWYDNSAGLISTAEHAPGSTSSLKCTFSGGTCLGGSPERRLFDPPAESVYASYWVKYGSGHAGSSELWFLSSLDPAYVGPGDSHSTFNFGQEDGHPRVHIADNENVDTNCIKLTSGEVLGCNGAAFDSYAFSEVRSVNGCNGIVGAGEAEALCLASGGLEYWSERRFLSTTQAFTDQDWHFVEVYVELNSREEGVGVPDGLLRYYRDGVPMLSYNNVLWRTGQYPDLALNQVFFHLSLSDTDSTIWLDDLTIGRGRK